MKNTAIKPLFDNILIKPLEAESKTASGIYLPDNVKEKPQMGIIIAVGDGRVTPKGDKEPVIVKVGQKVMYKKQGANFESLTHDIKINGEELVMVKEKDILAIVE